MEADIITLHVPLTRSGPNATYHLFDENRIRRLKRGAILINTSRGGVVETDALRRALSDGHLSTAVLDVWEKEPNIITSLLELVSLGTQHIAGHSLDGKLNALRMNYEAVCRFLSKSIDMEINASLLDSVVREIKIDTIHGSILQTLRDIVKQCYDITMDDQLLRQMISLPEKERGKYFSRLRTEYRIRREFFNYTICVDGEAKNLFKVLQLLGFQVTKAASL
jgi:erythronate-4-phosphate dehydrogenase